MVVQKVKCRLDYLKLLLEVEEDDEEVWVWFWEFLGTFLLVPPSSGNGAHTGSGDKSGKGWMTTGGMASGAVMTMSSVLSPCFGSSLCLAASVHFRDEVWTGSLTAIFKRNQPKLK